MPTYRDEAVVLRTHKLGEADRIITLLTRQHGRVRAVARACARRPRGSVPGWSRSPTSTSSSRRA
ncbi:DNA repair protein RecO, partial [Escherichia coli]|uniref:DNA repair protein RecO n=1 Tax=Escherichia coli TaxID=562 RepID=UPI0034D95AB9